VEFYRGAEYQVNFVPKVMVMLVVADDQAEQVLEPFRRLRTPAR